jgi:hypothetical protein
VTAFQAEYVDRKYIKTRLSYQLVFEVPAERIREVTAVLGELEGQQIWAAIARLADGAGSAPQASGPAPSDDDPYVGPQFTVVGPLIPDHGPCPYCNGFDQHKKDCPQPGWSAVGARIRTRAVMLCKDEGFRGWIWMRAYPNSQPKFSSEKSAADLVKFECRINSRAELATNLEAQKKFLLLEAQYRAETAEKRGT